MDNFFEILIYLLIIVSFLSSIFKKKKKPDQQKKQQQVPQHKEVDVTYSPEVDMESSPVKSSSTDEYDVLKELEQFFKVGEPKPPPQQIDVEQKKKTAEESWRRRTDSEHLYEDSWEKKRKILDSRKKDIDSQTSSLASRFEEQLNETKIFSSVFQRNIQKKLKHPASLKEYIIISEILGKPKALKHR